MRKYESTHQVQRGPLAHDRAHSLYQKHMSLWNPSRILIGNQTLKKQKCRFFINTCQMWWINPSRDKKKQTRFSRRHHSPVWGIQRPWAACCLRSPMGGVTFSAGEVDLVWGLLWVGFCGSQKKTSGFRVNLKITIQPTWNILRECVAAKVS